jgi:hypothetical protein
MTDMLTQTTTYELTPEGTLRDVATGDTLTRE